MAVTILVILLILIILMFATSVKVVQQSNVYIVERVRKYNKTLESGLHIVTPFIDRIAAKLDIREQVVNFQPQSVITKDNVTMQIDTVVYVAITDPIKYKYGVGNPISAL